jgi:glycosyltransferase involved in cell wall biosynthesis
MSLRVLVCSVYRESSGYGQAARDLILALDAAGADVACRPVQFTHGRHTEHPRIAELERKSFPGGSDVIFQHLPPYAQQYVGRGGLNVGSFYTETHPLPASWSARAALMDMQVVPTRQMRDTLLTAPHYRKPVAVVPLPCDPAKFRRDYPVPEKVREFGRGRFLFYTVGEHARRKNLSGLLRAFFAEFRPWEPVGLVVKTGIAGKAPDEAARHVWADVDGVRKGAKVAAHAPLLVLTDRLTDDELNGLHRGCDVFVQPSFGEAWSIPAFDALGFGKTPVVTAEGGYLEYVDDETGWLTPGRREPVFAEGDVHAELFTGRQTWTVPDLLALRAQMREAYEDGALRARKAEKAKDRVESFSHERVGAQLLRVLQDGQVPRPRPPAGEVVRLG